MEASLPDPRAVLAGLLAAARPVCARVADRVVPVAAGIALAPVAGGWLGKRIVRKGVV